MKTKYLVICVNENQTVDSVHAYDSEEVANAALAESARAQYDAIEDHDWSSIDVSPGDAEVVDGDAIWRWTVHPLVVE